MDVHVREVRDRDAVRDGAAETALPAAGVVQADQALRHVEQPVDHRPRTTQ